MTVLSSIFMQEEVVTKNKVEDNSPEEDMTDISLSWPLNKQGNICDGSITV